MTKTTYVFRSCSRQVLRAGSTALRPSATATHHLRTCCTTSLQLTSSLALLGCLTSLGASTSSLAAASWTLPSTESRIRKQARWSWLETATLTVSSDTLLRPLYLAYLGVGRSSVLVRSCFGLFYPIVPTFLLLQISHNSLAMILVSASSSYFTLAVPMREVYCVGYAPRAWDPRSLLSILDGPLYFGANQP